MTVNRSEILFMYDAQDCNPNGNPIGGNRPRRDPDTGEGIVTDVRLKRYLRDQLQDDGYNIYTKKVDGEHKAREDLVLNILEDIGDADDFEEIADIGERFLNTATDVRYFGATMSLDTDRDDDDKQDRLESLSSSLPDEWQGPVQFLPAKSLNEVELNEEYDSLTSVISTDESNSGGGGFDLDDKRIKYGIFPFWAVIDNFGAESTNLTEADVERLDSLCWRAIKNQTITRSKLGQEPRLYLRPEYEENSYHIGGLQNMVSLADDTEHPIRSVNDVVVDVTDLVDALETVKDRIKTLHVVGDDFLRLQNGDDIIQASDLGDVLENNGHSVHQINVLEERDLAE